MIFLLVLQAIDLIHRKATFLLTSRSVSQRNNMSLSLRV
nr:MAG TPA: hypothetical protein [Caudoviricetes sp.]